MRQNVETDRQPVAQDQSAAVDQGPVEIDPSEFQHIGGGSPKGTWRETDTSSPKGTWSSGSDTLSPKGTW